MTLLAPFPYFGGKRTIAANVWARFGSPTQYVEPFCGSAAVLLAAPKPASLEVICDASGLIANFWRAVKHQPAAVAEWADYPVSHIDLGARHVWLVAQIERIAAFLQDPDWPGDPKAAGWWLWGQCCWIGGGWCDEKRTPNINGKVPHVSDAGRGVQAIGQVPHVSDAGQGVQAVGQVPHIIGAGKASLLTSTGRTAWQWLHKLAERLERVRIVHGDWTRCLNHQYGDTSTAVFLDPPYRGFESVYGNAPPTADAAAAWARDHAHLRVALCGHRGDYDLPSWDVVEWQRGSATYSGTKTMGEECVWYSPACIGRQHDLFSFSASVLSPEEDATDSLASYNAAVMAIGERVKAGAPVPEFMLPRKAPP